MGAPRFSHFGEGYLAILIKTKTCTCTRTQIYLFLASILEKDANGYNVHKKGYTEIFNRVACNNQKVENDLILIYRGNVTLWKTVQRGYALSRTDNNIHTHLPSS